MTASVTVTNATGTTNGQTITINGNVRTWTNVIIVSSTQIQATNTFILAASNLFLAYAVKPEPQTIISHPAGNVYSNVLFQSYPGYNEVITLSAGWGTVAFTTNTISTNGIPVDVPYEIYGLAQRTNIASGLVKWLSLNVVTNAFTETNYAFTNFVGKTNAQTITGVKTFPAIAVTGGTITNATSIMGTNVIVAGILQFIDSSTLGLSNVATLTANSFIIGVPTYVQTNLIANQYWTYGNGPSYSRQIYDYTSDQWTLASTGVKTPTIYAYGVVGTNVVAANNLVVSNGASFKGTNNFAQQGDISFSRFPITSLANGNNAGVIVGTNVFIEVSGPSAAFTINGMANGRDGKLIYVVNQTGFDMTIAHQSGTDPTAANRIITMTGADRTTTGNGTATLIYSGAALRWLLVNFDQ